MAVTDSPIGLSSSGLGAGSSRGPARRESAGAKLANVDWSLTLFVLLLVPIGMTAIYSATRGSFGTTFLLRQGVFFAAGLVGMTVVAAIDYRAFRDFLGMVYIATAGALVLVLIVGKEVNGTKGWFEFGFVSVQPAEFAKLALVIVLAALFTGRTGSVDASRITAGLGVFAGLSFLVYLEGETGSILVYAFITLGIFVAAGVPVRIIVLLIASAAVMVSLILNSDVLADYQQQRLTSFVDETSPYAYNQVQSTISVASGGITGQGLFEGPQTQFGFVPQQRTDFIFTVIAEELGFVGAAVMLGLQALILTRIFRVAQLARDGFGALICVGVFSMILIQIFQNVGMTMRLMPITGIPLPFVSYGGSSLMTSLIGLGVVQSVAIHRHRGSPV